MSADRIVVIGASAGGVEAVTRIVHALPADFPAAVLVTIHFPPDAESRLPHILDRASALPVESATDHAPIEPGHVYVAPPDRHLLVARGEMRVTRGATENGNRPAIDPMFRSAALAFGRRVIGVILTGTLDDGTAGLLAIKRHGGIAIVQDPADAMFPSMPESALTHVPVDHEATLGEIAALLQRLVASPPPAAREGTPMEEDRRELAYASLDLELIEHPEDHPGVPSSFACPDCGGVLWETRDGSLVRYRCRVGHGWTSEGLVAEQRETLETALWTALRALEENAALNERLAARFERRGSPGVAKRFHESARLARARAALIRHVMAEERPQPIPSQETALREEAEVAGAGGRHTREEQE